MAASDLPFRGPPTAPAGGAHCNRRQIAGGAILVLCAAMLPLGSAAAGAARLVPPPAGDPTSGADVSGPQTIVVSGGCFWGVQAVYQHVKGVESAVSGYAGGAPDTAHYEAVSSGRTGHAESVKITFDPHVVRAGDLLRIFFSVVHDPTQRDRQGPDSGTQYRSAIFTTGDKQMALAKNYIEQLERAGTFNQPITTRVEPLNGFYPAESYHQDYFVMHPGSLYIMINDRPKVENLKLLFPNFYRAKPKLVGDTPNHS
ncbi:Peptide methionine sulfoxide reductase MsrA [Methylocella tundrae]|uniref:Peptide methionine sulfoxide reductase MsrA n=2 Tax=Methylocella tundrae TaxID=227605 RepID=A0A4U8Z2L3_METTU|nr:peptide-methionine (S)-S-oxide reductase MsrA [Methylocella tundrae]VFU09560.1 Peptide methionine sulfoxide reductase MsrA [Methylocella tundrae]